jgi:hypothetical protein
MQSSKYCNTIHHFMHIVKILCSRHLVSSYMGWGHYLAEILLSACQFFVTAYELRFECGSRSPLYDSHLVRWARLTPTDWRWKRAELWFRSGQLLHEVENKVARSAPLSDESRRWDLASKSQACNTRTERSLRGNREDDTQTRVEMSGCSQAETLHGAITSESALIWQLPDILVCVLVIEIL